MQRRDDSTRINTEIRVPQVRVVSADGDPLGILSTADAMARAQAVGLDLVEVAPTAEPPVCRIMDYGKFKYEKSKKAKEAKKKQHIMHLKEIKLHLKTDEHDFDFKLDHARKFLIKGDRVKVTVVFLGREITHIDFGRGLVKRVDERLSDIAQIELSGKMEGRNMISIYVPDKAKIKEVLRKQESERKKQIQLEPAADDNDQDVDSED
jgi:translation initiation factor IF-3